MKTSKIVLFAVVLWTLVETRNAGRLKRSLDVEGKGSNLTQKQQQEIIHADIVQHFTTTPSLPQESHGDTVKDSSSSLIKDVPLIPEDSNVQSLKNDDHLRVAYDKRISFDDENSNKDSSDKKNKTIKSNRKNFISYKYNQTGPFSFTRSEELLSHEHSSTPVISVADDSVHEKIEETHTRPVMSSTESLKRDSEWKNEAKKKEKGKKEILDSVTVPTDHIGGGRIEKPFKDNIISIRLKEKNRDSISEALDERRSTTSIISNSSSFSLSEHDNIKPFDSLDILKIDPIGTNNKESMNQSVKSVISSNGVNSELLIKPKEKFAVKRAHDDAIDSKINYNQMIEDTDKNTVPVLSLEPQTTPTAQTSAGKFADTNQYVPFKHLYPTDSGPTKIDILGKLATASPTSIIKPSVAFKQQLANKLKGLEPAPTAPMDLDVETDENQDKSIGKSSTKASQRKKPKGDNYAPPSEMAIPPTATAWTLVSMRTASDSVKSTRKPVPAFEIKFLAPEDSLATSTPRQTTITPISRVKSFVPWSTRLRKNTSPSPPTTLPIDGTTSYEKRATVPDSDISSSSNQQLDVNPESFKQTINSEPTTEEQSVIRSTLELDRNLTETSINLIQPTQNDIMVKDQSSTQDGSKTIRITTTERAAIPNPLPKDTFSPDTLSRSEAESKAAEIENIIETKQTFEENDTDSKTEEKQQGKEEKTTPSSTNNTVNEVAIVDLGENVNPNYDRDVSTSTPKSEIIEHHSKRNISDINEFYLGSSDILVDGVGEDGKSVEESEDEDYRLRHRTTQLPMFEYFETTAIPDFDEESDVDSYREDDEFAMVEKSTPNQTTTTTEGTTISTTKLIDIEIKSTTSSVPDVEIKSTTSSVPDVEIKLTNSSVPDVEIKSTNSSVPDVEIKSTTSSVPDVEIKSTTEGTTTSTTKLIDVEIKSTTSSVSDVEIKSTTSNISVPLDINTTGTYVTSFDIVSRENATLVVTKTPSEGDINWYNIVTKPDNSTIQETTENTSVEITTTFVVETTIEPESTTETSKQETTVLPETTEKVTTSSPITSMPITESTVPLEDDSKEPDACVLLTVHMSLYDFCQKQQQFKESIAKKIMTVHVSWEQIVSRKLDECVTKDLSDLERKEENLDEVVVCFIDEDQEPSPAIRDEFWKTNNSSIIVMPSDMSGFDNVLVAIILSIIAAICLVLLGILLVIIRKRQGRFNYGQRCTPVSLDDYSLDNISVYNSIRRKGALRASKRSYGNPAFDDPRGPTHPINFAGLANFSSDRAALDEEFNQIPMITVRPDELPPGVESKNRYANVIPLPETRVVLETKERTDPINEFINANFVKGPKSQEKLYIACQAPLQSTVEDFWRMVWQQQTKVILMLTALSENGVEKCADYLPQLEITDCHRLFGDFQITLKKHEVRENYIISNIQLKNLETNLWRDVTHMWYSSWPSQGVPDDGSAMIAFLIEARSYMRGAQGPTVVHCSPGTGRTGTVIAIDLCIRDFETLRSVDIPKTVYALRRDRAGAVQTKDQYAFIYQVLNLYATKLTGGALDSI